MKDPGNYEIFIIVMITTESGERVVYIILQ